MGSTEQIFEYRKIGFESAGAFLYQKPVEKKKNGGGPFSGPPPAFPVSESERFPDFHQPAQGRAFLFIELHRNVAYCFHETRYQDVLQCIYSPAGLFNFHSHEVIAFSLPPGRSAGNESGEPLKCDIQAAEGRGETVIDRRSPLLHRINRNQHAHDILPADLEIAFRAGDHQGLFEHGRQGLGTGKEKALVALRKFTFELLPRTLPSRARSRNALIRASCLSLRSL